MVQAPTVDIYKNNKLIRTLIYTDKGVFGHHKDPTEPSSWRDERTDDRQQPLSHSTVKTAAKTVEGTPNRPGKSEAPSSATQGRTVRPAARFARKSDRPSIAAPLVSSAPYQDLPRFTHPAPPRWSDSDPTIDSTNRLIESLYTQLRDYRKRLDELEKPGFVPDGPSPASPSPSPEPITVEPSSAGIPNIGLLRLTQVTNNLERLLEARTIEPKKESKIPTLHDQLRMQQQSPDPNFERTTCLLIFPPVFIDNKVVSLPVQRTQTNSLVRLNDSLVNDSIPIRYPLMLVPASDPVGILDYCSRHSDTLNNILYFKSFLINLSTLHIEDYRKYYEHFFALTNDLSTLDIKLLLEKTSVVREAIVNANRLQYGEKFQNTLYFPGVEQQFVTEFDLLPEDQLFNYAVDTEMSADGVAVADNPDIEVLANHALEVDESLRYRVADEDDDAIDITYASIEPEPEVELPPELSDEPSRPIITESTASFPTSPAPLDRPPDVLALPAPASSLVPVPSADLQQLQPTTLTYRPQRKRRATPYVKPPYVKPLKKPK